MDSSRPGLSRAPGDSNFFSEGPPGLYLRIAILKATPDENSRTRGLSIFWTLRVVGTSTVSPIRFLGIQQ